MPSYLLPATLRLSSELVGHTEPRGVINALHRLASWRGINVLDAWRDRGPGPATRPASSGTHALCKTRARRRAQLKAQCNR